MNARPASKKASVVVDDWDADDDADDGVVVVDADEDEKEKVDVDFPERRVNGVDAENKSIWEAACVSPDLFPHGPSN